MGASLRLELEGAGTLFERYVVAFSVRGGGAVVVGDSGCGADAGGGVTCAVPMLFGGGVTLAGRVGAGDGGGAAFLTAASEASRILSVFAATICSGDAVTMF